MKMHRPLILMTVAMLAASLAGSPALAGHGHNHGQGKAWSDHKIEQKTAQAEKKIAKATALNDELHAIWNAGCPDGCHTHDREQHKNKLEKAIEHLIEKFGLDIEFNL